MTTVGGTAKCPECGNKMEFIHGHGFLMTLCENCDGADSDLKDRSNELNTTNQKHWDAVMKAGAREMLAKREAKVSEK